MAMSNWDMLGMDQDFKPCSGLKNLSGDASVELYKNWLYVHDKRMWKEDGPFENDTIAQINDGYVIMSDFEITAKRGPQDSIFCMISLRSWEKKEDSRWFAGIGCYGYDDEMPRICKAMNVDMERYEPWATGTEMPHEGNDFTEEMFCLECMDKSKPEGQQLITFYMSYKEYKDLDLGSKYVGVTPETYKAFLAFLAEQKEDMCEDILLWFEKLESGEVLPVRFNQGDAFFADNGVLEGTPGSAVGEIPSEPVIMSMIKSNTYEPTTPLIIPWKNCSTCRKTGKCNPDCGQCGSEHDYYMWE